MRFTLVVLLLAGAFSAPATAADFAGLHYREIGPAIAAGRVTAVAGTDADPLVYYAGGADGGVYKTTDAGLSWKPVSDGLPVAAIGAIAISPKNENDVWVGTGEANARLDVEAGDGVWHSTDGGLTWTHMGLARTRYISTILVDPKHPHVVIIGAQGDIFRDNPDGGIYVTRDGGHHWTHTLYVGPASGASDVSWSAANPRVIFAGVWQVRRTPWNLDSGGPRDGIYRSDDEGLHWRRVTGGGLPRTLMGRIGISVASATRVYAMIQSREGALWRSDDGGFQWHRMPEDPLIGHRPFYFSRIYADPANPDRVINLATYMSLSTEGGRRFHVLSPNAGYDDHVLWWSHDGRRIINGNDTGVILSTDSGATWSEPRDLPFAQVYHVGLGREIPNYQICVGLQDVNSWCGPSSTNNGTGVLNRDWNLIAPGDGMWSLFDPVDPAVIWSSESNRGSGQIYLTDLRTHQSAEVSPYKRDTQGLAPDALPYRFNWETPIAFLPGSPPRTLVGGNAVFATSDRGAHWEAVSGDLTRNDKSRQGASGGPITLDMSGAEVYDTILDVAPSPLDQKIVWVSTDDGLVQVSRDGARTWYNVTPRSVPAWSRIPTVEPGWFERGYAYVVVDRHMSGDDQPYVFETTDFGRTWRSIAGDLPRGLFARVIRQDRKNPRILYLGTQRGVYVTLDGGAHWRSLRLNMPASAVYDIEIQPQRNDLVVGTHGRGVWILDDLAVVQRANDGNGKVELIAPRDAFRMWQWAPLLTFDTADPLPRNEFYGRNAPLAMFTYVLPRAEPSTPDIEILDEQRRIVRHLGGLQRYAGIHRVEWDLSEDGPVTLTHGPRFDRGPEEGPEVLPGNYIVRLVVGKRAYEQPLAVRRDPRDPATPQQYQSRHAFLTQLFAQFSRVDRLINSIDDRMDRGDTARGLSVLRDRLTQHARNELELLAKPPRVRERILNELGRMSSSFQAPTEADWQQEREFENVIASCERDFARYGRP